MKVEGMRRSLRYINIPSEVLRTLVAISELRNFARAGKRLGLSQPAISAQMKRLQMIVGNEIFDRSTNGLEFTPRGKLVLTQAKKLLEANDQILSIGGGEDTPELVRLGLSPSFIDQFVAGWQQRSLRARISVTCDHSVALAKAYQDDYLDVVCLSNSLLDHSQAICRWEEDLVWVKGRDFVLQPGHSIPLIGWPGSPRDRTMTNAIEKAGLAYRFVLASADLQVRTAAVAAGMGLTASTRRQIPVSLSEAKEYDLPALAPVQVGIFVRSNFNSDGISTLIDSLKALEPPRRRAEIVPANSA